MSLSSFNENGPSNDATIGYMPFDLASTCARLGLYSQLIIAAGCMMAFEGYLQTGCHPLGWQESAVRFAHSFRWVFFLWVTLASVFARSAIWRRLICVLVSYILAEIINEVYWGAIVRY
jgi:hypothetical protein